MSEEPETRQSQPPTYLDHDGIKAALEHLTTNFPMSKWKPAEEDAYRDILCQLHPGELRPALSAACQQANDPRFRPEAYAVLSIVLETRDAAKRELARAEAEANANRMRELAREEPPPVGAHAAMRRVMEDNRKLPRPFAESRKPKVNQTEQQEAS